MLHAGSGETFARRAATVTARRMVTLYGRAGCGLCEEAATLLRRWQTDLGFDLDEVDIDRDAALLAAYNWVVPVIAVDGVELARAPVDPAALRARLRQALAH